MSQIQCFLAQVNAGILPAGLADQLPAEIATHYSTGSKGVIDLVVAQSPVPPKFPINEPVGAYYLHDMLGAVTGNQTHPPKIAVLYASSYAISTPGVLGVMFDRGFTTDDDPNPVNQPARLGCAVFLDTIRRLRGDGVNLPRRQSSLHCMSSATYSIYGISKMAETSCRRAGKTV